MNAKTRRTLEMGKRALEFSRTHSDASPGYAAALSRLEERLTRAEQLAGQQRNGILESRAASATKRDLRRLMRRSQLVHLASVAEIASKEVPELEQKFLLTDEGTPFLTFRTAARAMQAEAQSRKELLVKHGLADTVLDSLTQALDQFDQAIQQGTEGRREHVGASAELDNVASEIIQVVRVMDGLNRYRFAKDGESLASWESASNTFGPLRSTSVKPAPTPQAPPTAGNDIKPAAA
jgi:hypothetical protein